MVLNVYLSQDNHYVLIPDCLLPSLHCQSLRGSLRLRGSVSIADFPDDRDWSLILAQIDRQTFVLASVAEARRLLGGDHGCLVQEHRKPDQAEAGLDGEGLSPRMDA